MRIGVLSRSSRIYSTRRLIEAARARGHRARVLDTMAFTVSLEEEFPDLYYKSKPLPNFDAIVPRIGSSITYFGTAVVRQLEQMDVFCGNSALGILNSRDKLRSLQMLSRHKIGIPATEFATRRSDILPAIERVGGAPVILKLLEGTQGVGVILADSNKMAEAIVETFQSTRQNLLIQKFVAESKGKDIRAIVVGGKVVAAMRRVAQGQEFRSNVHRGGRTEACELDSKYEATAIRAAQVLGLSIAGVDMLESSEGPQVAEVNSSPGLEGIEKATGIDIATSMIEFLEERVRFPELDVRQRLTVSRGYGVAELPIPKGSRAVGLTVAETGLVERDVAVLTLYRDQSAIPNPKPTQELEAGDRLLCYGKLSAMGELLPERPARRRRKRRTKRRA